MSDNKPKFFFEEDPQPEGFSLTPQEHTDTFFSILQSTGIIQDNPLEDMEAKKAEADASMKKMESRVLVIEYGTYQDNYAVHLTPIHPQKNLKDDVMVKAALRELVVVLNEHVPHELNVKLFMPRSDWAMKVISAVVDRGAGNWNFNYNKLEEDGIPKIFQAVEKIIMAQ